MKILAIAALVACSALFAAQPGRAADPHHDHGAGGEKLQLDHGRKWATDAPLRRGMAAIREAVHGAPAPLHEATATPPAYAALATRIEGEVGRIVTECKLPPAADAQLHLVIAEVIAGTDAMKAAGSGRQGQAGLARVGGALAAYARHFEHPGW